jgi:hypothetical protein
VQKFLKFLKIFVNFRALAHVKGGQLTEFVSPPKHLHNLSRSFTMNKLIAALVAGLFSVSAFAASHASAPAASASAPAASAPAAASADASAKPKAKKHKKAKKAASADASAAAASASASK